MGIPVGTCSRRDAVFLLLCVADRFFPAGSGPLGHLTLRSRFRSMCNCLYNKYQRLQDANSSYFPPSFDLCAIAGFQISLLKREKIRGKRNNTLVKS